MARRKKNESLTDMFAAFPWWTVLAGSIAFLAMYMLPSILAKNPVFHEIALLSRSFAWLPLLVFGCLALVSLARSKFTGGMAPNTRERRRERRTWRDTSVNISRLRFNHGWGVTRLGGMQTTKPKRADTFDSWSLAALRALEWKRFELLCAQYYESAGFQSQTIRCGADGGIDMKLFKTDPAKPLAVVQCKSWNVYSVGVKEMRELLGVMAHEKVNRGVYITTGSCARDALSFAGDNSIQLLDGDGFLRKLLQLPKDRQDLLLKSAFNGDYKTPTCPSCGIKMTKREGKAGPSWGCVNYPKCSCTFAING
jgi:restriction system protein